MWAVLVAVLKLVHVFTEALLALFTRKDHFHGLLQVVVLRLGMALGTIEPLLAAWGADGHLSIENVFAEGVSEKMVITARPSLPHVGDVCMAEAARMAVVLGGGGRAVFQAETPRVRG